MGVEHLHLSFVRRKEVPHAHLTPLHVLVSQKLTHKATSHSLQQHQRLAALQPLGQWLVSFREWLGHDQNVVLLLDGHSTRTVRGMPELAASLNIFMVLMYPNCTHGLQPCDKVYYSYHRRLAGVISEKVMLEQEACASLGHDAATKIPDELIISPVLACLFEIDAIIPEPKPSAMPFTPFHNRQTLEYAPPVYDDECGEMQQVEAMPTPRPRGRPPARLAHADSLSRPALRPDGTIDIEAWEQVLNTGRRYRVSTRKLEEKQKHKQQRRKKYVAFITQQLHANMVFHSPDFVMQKVASKYLIILLALISYVVKPSNLRMYKTMMNLMLLKYNYISSMSMALNLRNYRVEHENCTFRSLVTPFTRKFLLKS
eukprot:m.311152 g.311152  ORF g.311152 m.311152 type:complete len:371 (-) comp15952_c0_seq26:1051-2163(-)